MRLNAGDARDVGLITGSGRSSGGGNHSGILAWEIPWTEEPTGYSPWNSKELPVTEQLKIHVGIHKEIYSSNSTSLHSVILTNVLALKDSGSKN